jgi:hypothetical protein
MAPVVHAGIPHKQLALMCAVHCAHRAKGVIVLLSLELNQKSSKRAGHRRLPARLKLLLHQCAQYQTAVHLGHGVNPGLAYSCGMADSVRQQLLAGDNRWRSDS